MVKNASGKDGYRSFKIVKAGKHDSCKTKFNEGKYIGKTPGAVAKKAAKELCRVKRIRGVCTLYIAIQETTQGSKKKVYTYKCHRRKLKVPIILMEGTDSEYVVEYKMEATPTDKININDCKDPDQSVGRKKKRTAKKTRKTPNNVRRYLSKVLRL